MLVGEAPGDTEVAQGRPFVGRAGQLLDRVLNEVGISRADCYIDNACVCRPTPHRAPRAAEVRACRDRLLAEVRARVPRVVVALGNAALLSLLGKSGIQDERGTVNWSSELGAYVVPTYHPAAVLRNPNLYIDVVRDFHRVAGLLEGRVQAPASEPTVKCVVVRTWDDLADVVRQIQEAGAAAVDVETASDGRLLCVGFSWQSGEAVVIPRSILEQQTAVAVLNEALRDVKLWGHNLKYDMQRLWDAGITATNADADTMLMHYCLDERQGIHGLKALARRYLGAPDYDTAVKRYYNRMEECPEEDLWRYNACDVAYTYALKKVLERELGSDEQRALSTLLHPAVPVLARMEYLGIMVDTSYLKDLATKLQGEVHELEQKMYAVAGREFNPRSPKQLVQLLYYELGLPIPCRLSTDEEALTAIREFHPLPSLLLEYRGKLKMLRTYVEALLEAADADGRVHTTFNLHGTITGRLSSSNPVNLQNIPKTEEARNAFIAAPGYKLVECDLSQAEVRVLAWYCKDPNLIKALSEGGDLHIRTACIMFRKKPEEVTPEMRQAAKRLTFGVVYGMSAEGLAGELGVSVTEAKELQKQFFGAFPRVREWIRAQQELALTTGVVTTPFGRKRRFEYVTKENRGEVMRQAVNTPIQSLASDITLSALIRAGQALGKSPATRLLLTVHDSIVLETAEDPVDVGRWLRDLMVSNVLDNTVPFDAEVSIGDRWGSLEKVKF